jgi:hypothetical protein
MSNIDLVTELITAIHFDRFAEIEARHRPAAAFQSFRGPDLHSSVSIADWHREFLRDYADCNYSEVEFIEQKEMVVIRAKLEAKGYDWRQFSQNVIEVFRFEDDLVIERRQYAMLRNIALEDRAMTRQYDKVKADRTAKGRRTRKAVPEFYDAVLAGDRDTAAGYLDENAILIDSVYGVVMKPDAVLDVLLGTPRPAFGVQRTTNLLATDQAVAVELAIDPARPRTADWVRMLGEQIGVIERHWMLREIGLLSSMERERHTRRVLHPV